MMFHCDGAVTVTFTSAGVRSTPSSAYARSGRSAEARIGRRLAVDDRDAHWVEIDRIRAAAISDPRDTRRHARIQLHDGLHDRPVPADRGPQRGAPIIGHLDGQRERLRDANRSLRWSPSSIEGG
jgi:hypothetical protein